MEDEDVDSVSKIGVPVENCKLDGLVKISNETKSTARCKSDDNTEESNEVKEEDSSLTIDRLKNAICHEVDRCNDNIENNVDSSSSSPKKLNGEVDKSDGVVSSEESSDYDKEKEDVEEDARNKQDEVKDDNNSPKDCNKRKLSHSDESNDSGNEFDESSDSSHVDFKSFCSKRRKLLESGPEKAANVKEVNKQIEVLNSDVICVPEKPKQVELRRSARHASLSKKHSSEAIVNEETKEETGDQLTEYAQYLGLQPTVKFKCGRCGEKDFQSMASLNAHQMICCKTASSTSTKQSKPLSDSNSSTNFRITRKVYLCSACGTYYENWKLFLHMRDMHKRHICLFCLGMFSVADRLAEHLLYQHNVHEKICKSPEEFLNLFKGSCYLTCCSCEKMFTERDEFYDHQCKDSTATTTSNWNDSVSLTPKDIKELAQKCNLCGVKCGHYKTCPKVAHKFQQTTPPSSFASGTNSSNGSSSNISLEKYYIPVPTNVQKNWSANNLNQEILKQALSLSQTEKDYYDVGSAASFCHVDIANDSDNQSLPDKTAGDKLNPNDKNCSRSDNPSPSKSQDVQKNATESDKEEEKSDSSKSLPVSNNLIINSVSEENDNSDSRHNQDKCKSLDELMEIKVVNEEANKTPDATNEIPAEESDKESNEENRMPVEESNNESQNEDETPAEESDGSKENKIPVEDSDGESEDNITQIEDSSKESIEENAEPTEESNKESEDKDKTPVDDIDMIAADVEKNPSDEHHVTENVSNETEDKESTEDDTSTENQVDSEKELPTCFVKLDTVNENTEDFTKTTAVEEEDIQHDSASNDESSISANSCSSNSSSSSGSRRNSTDTVVNDIVQDTSTNEMEKIESSDKTETPLEDLNINEETGHNTLDSSSNNDENVSDKENSDTRLEANENSIDKSDEIETQCNDKTSAVVSDDGYDDDPCEDVSNDNHTAEEVESPKSQNQSDQEDTNPAIQQAENSCDSDVNVSCGSEEPNIENHVETEESHNTLPRKESSFEYDGVTIQLANEEVMAMALTLDGKMEELSSQSIIKECVRTSCTTCSYCSHAVKIAVNGKQLAIHLLTEHRYTPVKNETTEDIVEKLKQSLDELRNVWFNTDSYDSSDKLCFVIYDHTYECFQCNYVANTHKDLFSHKRKVHQKTILYCSMCKENFYSYSELLCHMCPGLYDAAKDIQFRCCLCTTDRIPSAFRLMVHLRKSHHTCDICLENVDDQQKLSVHMVKHKLHHLCYRCGIAYRNKPDITKHLFWKHGTESVLCKKCLQKKWPHVYHFCVPPNSFICEECNLSFSKAVFLKVHKRFHNNNLPYVCNICEHKFVSKKLLTRHEKTHETHVPTEEIVSNVPPLKSAENEKSVEQNATESCEHPESLPTESIRTDHVENPETTEETTAKAHKKKSKRDREKKIKPVVDVYDLPPLNLSSESDDSEDERDSKTPMVNNVDNSDKTNKLEGYKIPDQTNDQKVEEKPAETENEMKKPDEVESTMETEESTQPVTVVDGVWDNFHTYKAEQEKRGNLDITNKQTILSQLEPEVAQISTIDAILGDHDYCLPDPEEKEKEANESNASPTKAKSNEHSSSIDHDYCTQKNNAVEINNLNTPPSLNAPNQSENTNSPVKRKQKSPKKKVSKQHNSSSSSDSSTDSDSSSCSCGTNCSCSSSSSNSSSSSSSDSDSSSSDGRNNSSNMNANNKREKKKERLKSKKKGELSKPVEPAPPAEEPVVNIPIEPEEPLIRESDLDTDETATDEEFYDQYPQMQANQILAEKRNQLMLLASVAPTVNNGTASPPVSSSTNINLDLISSPKLEIVAPPVTPAAHPPTQSKKKVKTKKRRKSSLLSKPSKNRNISKHPNVSYDTQQPSTSFTPQWHVKKVANDDISPIYIQPPVQTTPVISTKTDRSPLVTPISQHHKSSEGSSKRFSKRRRVRNKFYGYSSDEDGEHNQSQPPPAKWKKAEGTPRQNQQQFYTQPFNQQPVNTVQPEYNHGYQQTPIVPPKTIQQPVVRTTFNENQMSNSLLKRIAMAAPLSSGSSSDSDADSDSDENQLTINQQITAPIAPDINAGTSEKDDKLYCYCQCPYDEVSEMIACDGVDCTIEWFHFECVGIMVPPKGKWYCPDCRKRRGLS